MTARLLITGASGQLGGALAALAPDAAVLGRAAMDFDRPETIAPAFAAVRPDLVINAAAYTSVDRAESEREAAFRANAEGPGALAGLCAAAGVPLIHISTDYVFDGTKGAPYRETDPARPIGAYGASKRAGEEAVLAQWSRAIILRTSWVYAPWGANFLRTMLAAARRTGKLRVVADQRGTPSYAPDLARAILAIAARIAAEGWREDFAGLTHMTGTGETTWHGFAEAIFAEAARHGLARPEVAPIATADWPTPTRRPADSRLDCTRLRAVFGLALPDWREAVVRAVDAVFAAPAARG